MNHDHRRSFVFYFRIDNERLHFALAVLDLHPFLMPGRFLEAGLGPILGLRRRDQQRNENGKSCDSSHTLVCLLMTYLVADP